jgi:hypothetical protein
MTFRVGCAAATRFEHPRRPQVRIGVRGRTAVFQITIPPDRHGPRDAHRGATVGHPGPKLMQGAGLVQAGVAARASAKKGYGSARYGS